jgi:protein-disulfide isomerase
MRLILAFLGLFLLTAAAPARDWTAAVRQTPQGAYVVGNPAAPLKLVEYGSYTCSHCADFAKESDAVLKGQMVKSGRVSVEYRHLIRDQFDLAAAVLARCAGPRGFFGASQAIFLAQPVWLEKAMEWQQANGETQYRSNDERLRAAAQGAGLIELMQKRGLTPGAMNACFADEAAIKRIVKLTEDAPADVQYTPFFFLNGTAQPNMTWAKLESILRAGRAR